MKAVLHIGTHKTGTSTIQEFLKRNRDDLKKQGIVYPTNPTRSDSGNHTGFAAATYIPAQWASHTQWFASKFGQSLTQDDQDKLWEKMRHDIEKKCHKNDVVIFSCEALSTFSKEEVEKVKQLMDSLFDDTEIVLYLRRPVEWLVSLYAQRILKPWTWKGTMPEFINSSEDACKCLVPYDETVKRWAIFGKDKIRIRLFDKKEFHNNDLIDDFAQTVGFDISQLERTETKNVSLGSAETEFLRLLNDHIPYFLDPWTRNPDHGIMRSTLHKITQRDKSYHLSRGEALQILDKYRDGNNWIAREFFGREILFNEDVSMYPEEVACPHGLTLERSVEICAQLIKSESIGTLRQQVLSKSSIFLRYYRYKILAKLTFGKTRKHYEKKRDLLHKKVRQIRQLR